MRNVADALDLSGRTVRLAQTFYETTESGDPDQRALASLYLATQEHSYGIGLMEFADVASYPTGEISAVVRELRGELYSRLERRPPGIFVDVFIEKLNQDFGADLGHEVTKTAFQVTYNDSGDLSTIAVAAGAIYIAAHREEKQITQQQIAEVAEINQKTIQNAVTDLTKD
jgi:transcription initiation factor TFIIIB Brf1 subunit/transcription initiation factor TFIIB